MQLLADGIERLADSAEWQRWLFMASKLPNYSFSNQLLILAQRPDATKVCGLKTWNGLGRHVKRGERALTIMAPSFPSKDTKRVVEDADEVQAERRPVYYRAVPVFALEQTDGDPLPQPVKRLTGDTAGDLFDRLAKYSAQRGTPVTVEHIEGGANGFFDPIADRIVIGCGLAPNQQAKTLAHELGHSILHRDLAVYREHRADSELDAESTAFIILNNAGIDSGAYSWPYVASWQGGGDAALKALKTSAQRIQKTARMIICAIEPEAGVEAPAA